MEGGRDHETNLGVPANLLPSPLLLVAGTRDVRQARRRRRQRHPKNSRGLVAVLFSLLFPSLPRPLPLPFPPPSPTLSSFLTHLSFPLPTPGDRYRDTVLPPAPSSPLKKGDTCSIRYRALRLGKRSRDGLSGEASTVFSFGYGEDDDKYVGFSLPPFPLPSLPPSFSLSTLSIPSCIRLPVLACPGALQGSSGEEGTSIGRGG